MKILDLKKLMLLPLICCVSIQQVDAKVVYSPGKTRTFKQKINKKINEENNKNNKNKHATINDVAHEAFELLLPKNKKWHYNDEDIQKSGIWKIELKSEMPGIAAFIPTKENNAIDYENVKVYVGCKYHYNKTKSTTPPNNTPNKTYGIAPLFRYSDYSHTERQLAICALTNANNKENEIITVTNSYNFLYPNNTLNLGNIRNINNVFEPETAKKIVGKMVNTEGILCIYTPKPMCTYSTNLADNGGILCVDYYAYLLQCCPEIKIHVYCNSQQIDTLSPHMLDNVSVNEILNEMHQLLQDLPTYKYNINAPIIKYIKNGSFAKKNNKWQFIDRKRVDYFDKRRYIYATKETRNIKNDILYAIQQYLELSRLSQYKTFRDKILTTLIRLCLTTRHPNLNKDKDLNRLTMHLIAPK